MKNWFFIIYLKNKKKMKSARMRNVAIAKIDELQNSYWQTHNDHLKF